MVIMYGKSVLQQQLIPWLAAKENEVLEEKITVSGPLIRWYSRCPMFVSRYPPTVIANPVLEVDSHWRH